jgi:RNA polymerase sigma-70 factor (ECF subfamily)
MACIEGRVPWTELEDRLRPFIQKRVAREHDADDVLQEVLLRIHRGLATLEDEERFDAWMYRVARNAISDHLRSRQKHPLAGDAPEPDADPIDEDDRAASRDLSRCISGFVAMLPSPYREAITLTELEGRTQKEAAEMLGISLSGMKSRVQRGRAKLRGLLEECCEVALDARGRVVDYEPRRRC